MDIDSTGTYLIRTTNGSQAEGHLMTTTTEAFTRSVPSVGYNPTLDVHLPDKQGWGGDHSTVDSGRDSPLVVMNQFEQQVVERIEKLQAACFNLVLDSVHKVAKTVHQVQEQQGCLSTVVQNLNTQVQDQLSPTPTLPGKNFQPDSEMLKKHQMRCQDGDSSASANNFIQMDSLDLIKIMGHFSHPIQVSIHKTVYKWCE